MIYINEKAMPGDSRQQPMSSNTAWPQGSKMFKKLQIELLALVAAALWVGAGFAAVSPVGEGTQVKVARAGERYQGNIRVHNNGSSPAEIKLYQTDYSFKADGSSDYGAPGSLPRSNAKWISLVRQDAMVPPNTTVRIDYEVRVPAGEALSGSYWSMIMVEPIAKDSAEAAEPLPERTTGIKVNTRYGIQIITEIGKTGEPGLAFSDPQLQTDGGKRVFSIAVENTGQRWLRPALSLELYSDSGNPVGKFQGERKRLFPGTAALFSIELGDVPKGKYLGLVVADGTGDNLFGANVELEIE